MKKILIIIIPFILWGCKRDFNSVIDTQPVNFQVTKIKTASSFTYQPSDSLITISVEFNSSKDIISVYANVFDPSMNQINLSPIILFDNGNIPENGDTVKGDNIYSDKFPLSHYYLKGNYQIQFFVTDILNNTSLVAYHSFAFDNGLPNLPPVISDLVMVDSVDVGVDFIFTIKASDPNGFNDLRYVYFQLYRPDGSQVTDNNGSTKFVMPDNGDYAHFGDVSAGDGIFSYKNSFNTNAPAGTWKFVFQAMDKEGLLSNTISHNLVVK